MLVDTCQSFSEISWQNFFANPEIFYKLRAFGVSLNVRSLLSLWQCKMVAMTTAARWNGGEQGGCCENSHILSHRKRLLQASSGKDIIRLFYL